MPQKPLSLAAFWIALLLLPSTADAQKDVFLNSFIEFHSALLGTNGDEGAVAVASLDRMAVSLEVWERLQAQREAELKQTGAKAGDFARFYAEHARFEEATRAIEAAIGEEPGAVSLHLTHGLLLEAAGRHQEATNSFARASGLDTADPFATYHAASRLMLTSQRQEFEQAVARLVTATSRTQFPRISLMRVELISDLASSRPVFSPAAYEEGFGLLLGGRYRDAIARFRSVVATDPLVTDPAGRHQRARAGIAALRAQQTAAAIEHLEAAAVDLPQSSEAHRMLGAALRMASRLPEAIEHLETAVRLQPGDERARVLLGVALADLGKAADAERVLRQTIELLPRSGEARWTLAIVLNVSTRRVEALALLEEAASLAIVAGKGPLFGLMADIADRQNDHDRSIAAATQSARLRPNEARLHRELGLIYLHKVGLNEEALVELLVAAMLGDEEPATLTALGQIHLAARRLDAAEQMLRRVIAVQPNNAPALYALGLALMQLGKTAEGQQHLEEFQRLRASTLTQERQKFEQSTPAP